MVLALCLILFIMADACHPEVAQQVKDPSFPIAFSLKSS